MARISSRICRSRIFQRGAMTSIKAAHENSMQLAQSSPRTPANGSEYAFAEIHAYISIRERLLADAEYSRSEAMIDRAEAANEYVESCLKPARSPYQGQHLAEGDAQREWNRCLAVKVRLQRIRAKIAHAA